MPTMLILESANDADLDLLLHLAQRLGVKAITSSTTPAAEVSATEQARLAEEFAGSWQSDENGTELARQIREARFFRDRDVNL